MQRLPHHVTSCHASTPKHRSDSAYRWASESERASGLRIMKTPAENAQSEVLGPALACPATPLATSSAKRPLQLCYICTSEAKQGRSLEASKRRLRIDALTCSLLPPRRENEETIPEETKPLGMLLAGPNPRTTKKAPFGDSSMASP